MDILAEGITSLRENAKGTSEAIENAFGPELSKKIADTFQQDPIKAVQLLSAEQAKLNQNSKESAELIANVFKGAGEDSVKGVQSVAEFTTSLDDLKEKSGETGKRLERLRVANEELAATQQEVRDVLSGTGSGVAELGAQIQTGLLKYLIALIDVFSEVFGKIKEENKRSSKFNGEY